MKNFLLLLLLTAATTSYAQPDRPLNYKKAVGISPLALADVDNTIMLTGEYRLQEKLSVLADVGYIFASSYLGAVEKTSGFHIRPSVRFYTGRRNRGYVQAQAFYKSATYTLHDWIGKDCVNGVPAYEEQKDFNYRKSVTGVNLIAGGVFPLSQSHKWLIDLYGGLGIRYKTHKLVHEPNACYNIGDGFFNFFTGNLTTVSVPAGVRLTFVLE